MMCPILDTVREGTRREGFSVNNENTVLICATFPKNVKPCSSFFCSSFSSPPFLFFLHSSPLFLRLAFRRPSSPSGTVSSSRHSGSSLALSFLRSFSNQAASVDRRSFSFLRSSSNQAASVYRRLVSFYSSVRSATKPPPSTGVSFSSTPPFVQQPSHLCRPAFLLLPPFVQQPSRLRRPAFLLLPPFVQIDSGDKKMPTELINANPIVYGKQERRVRKIPSGEDEYARDLIDQQEIFDHIRDIRDPEHPYSLEELKVVTEDHIEVNDEQSHIRVTFTPTVEHCSMATVIGLCLRVKLMRSLPTRFKVDIRVAPGSHATEAAVNKQLNDKERVAAALENPALLEMVNECLAPSYE